MAGAFTLQQWWRWPREDEDWRHREIIGSFYFSLMEWPGRRSEGVEGRGEEERGEQEEEAGQAGSPRSLVPAVARDRTAKVVTVKRGGEVASARH